MNRFLVDRLAIQMLPFTSTNYEASLARCSYTENPDAHAWGRIMEKHLCESNGKRVIHNNKVNDEAYRAEQW